MKGNLSKIKAERRIRLGLYLIGSELLIAGGCTALTAAMQHFTTTLVLSLLIAMIGGTGLLIPSLISKNPGVARRIVNSLQSPYGQIAPSGIVIVLSAFLFLLAPSVQVILLLSPLLICIWLIGIELLLLFHSQQTKTNEIRPAIGKRSEQWMAILGLLLACSIALIPSRFSSILDGIPLDTPIEFVFVMLLLPLAFIAGQRFFARKFVLWSLGVLLILKITLMIFLPQAGLGVRLYSNEADTRTGRWEKSYYTFISPSYTQIAQAPYYSFRQFPIEWINQFAFDQKNFWVTLDLQGAVQLAKNERLVFIVQGAKQAQLEMRDLLNQRAVIPATLVDNSEDLNANLFKKAPEVDEFEIQGTLVLKNFGQSRFEPVILYPDGSTRSALGFPRIWPSVAGMVYSFDQLKFLQYLMNFLGLAVIGLVSAGLLIGIFRLYRSKQLTSMDLFLASSGLLAFFIAGITPKPQLNVTAIIIISVLAGIKLIDLAVSPRDQSFKALLFSMGVPWLLIFLTLEINSLRSIYIFPQGQDGLEYQVFARSIFVKGDLFLAQTPPRAYKVLFPYLVGILHGIFGQSASAQLFLNAWSGLLSGILIAKLMKKIITTQISFVASTFFLVILCLPSTFVYYFRFGLIEPVAILLLLVTFYLAINRHIPGMFASGILTVLFRLDYLGAVFAAIILTSEPIIGTAWSAWKLLSDWFGSHWKLAGAYALSLCSPPFLIILGYFMFTPHYMLNASDTHQRSVASILESLLSVIIGWPLPDLRVKFLENPVDVLLIATPLALGFLIASASIFLRKGIFNKIDPRLGLVIFSILPAYILARPVAYFPRFSLSILPLDLILIGALLHYLYSGNKSAVLDR